MPTYSFKCDDCETHFEVVTKINEMWNQACPCCGSNHYKTYLTEAPVLGDPVRLGIRQTDAGFKEVLSKIHNANYKSNLADKLSRS